MLTLHGSKTMREITSFFKLLGNIKIDGLCIKNLTISILLHGKHLVERVILHSRISGIENMDICNILLLLTHFSYKIKLYKNTEAEIREKIKTK